MNKIFGAAMTAMYSFKIVVLVAVSCLTSFSASATPILDQNNPVVHGGRYCRLGILARNNCGQSFRPMADNISGAGIFIDPTSDPYPGTVTFKIYSAYYDYLGGLGDLIASGTSGIINNNSGWVDVFWSPVEVSPDRIYFLVATSVQYNIYPTYSIDNNYPHGSGVSYGKNASNVRMDMTFRTYTDGNVVTVPEPASLTLLGLGLIGFTVARRKFATRT